MYALANTVIDVHRGDTTNGYGDTVTDPATSPVVTAGIAAYVEETSNRVWDAANQVARVIRGYQCMVQSDTDLRTGDLIVEKTGLQRTFQVDEASQPGGPAWTPDLAVTLKRLDTGARGG